jgi:hypothetical protein
VKRGAALGNAVLGEMLHHKLQHEQTLLIWGKEVIDMKLESALG